MNSLFLGFVYLMFFLSGAAALMYEVVWVRSLGLIFGGSHLAVTTVLSVYMGGLALGSYIIGKHVQRSRKPLRLYGLLEIGIGFFAVVFALLAKLYPSIYISLAHGKDHSLFYLSFVRVAFSVIALIVPTTLMGGTLPVLSTLISKQGKDIGRHLSFLYGLNTLGAVAGTVAAGFYFLRFYSVSTTFAIAVLINLVVGITSILLQGKSKVLLWKKPDTELAVGKKSSIITEGKTNTILPLKMVLWGIGISGFCALGYEVLWTKVLTIVVGASVYGFTTMLVAFLTGIALGSKAYGLYLRLVHKREITYQKSVLTFGAVQVVIGITALAVTYFIRDLPSVSLGLRGTFQAMKLDLFAMQQWANLTLAFIYMVVPAFFMGLAFPLAGKVHAEYRKTIGSAVGEVLAYNTIGAILGAALSGFVMAYVFSIERSLQILTVINIGFGLLVIFGLNESRRLLWGIGGLVTAAIIFLAVNPDAFRMWNTKYFAIFRANQPEIFRTPEMVSEALANTEVLYYQEGVEAIVSAIKIKGGDQAFITNGRVEASNNLQDQQLQFTLGHLPMLLNKNPKRVLVVGLGSGMTLGAISVHPGVDRVVLVELEPKMTGVARTFRKYNHNVLDHPKLDIIFNDGRNFLLTTGEKFDVITADPIHPWFRGAGYLYTTEYFKLASEHLSKGGIMCQWLPIYELTVENLKSVVKTFQRNFKYTMLWLTYYDSVIIGSDSPIMIDEAELDRKIKEAPAIRGDLERMMMGSAKDFLSYFAMGTKGMKAFSEGGLVNTDDNLYLEFSAPLNIGKGFLMRENLEALVKHREDILPYLVADEGSRTRENLAKAWEGRKEATKIYDRAHALFLGGKYRTAEFQSLLADLDQKYPSYGPGIFLKNEYLSIVAREPRLLKQLELLFANGRGRPVRVELCAVTSRVSSEMAILDIVDNNARIVYGHLDVPGMNREEYIQRFVDDLIDKIQILYRNASQQAYVRGNTSPPLEPTLDRIKGIINNKVNEGESFLAVSR